MSTVRSGFYRQLGLPVPEPEGPDPHVDLELPGGHRLSFDAEQTITGMHPDWTPSDRAGRVALAFGLDSPAEVDTMFERLTEAGHPGALEPYDAPWVSAMPPSSTRTATWWTCSQCLPVELAPSRPASGEAAGLEHQRDGQGAVEPTRNASVRTNRRHVRRQDAPCIRNTRFHRPRANLHMHRRRGQSSVSRG